MSQYRQGALELLGRLALLLERLDDCLELGQELIGEELALSGHLGVHLGAGGAQKEFGKLLRAVRAIRRRLAETFGELRLRLDERRHQLTEGA